LNLVHWPDETLHNYYSCEPPLDDEHAVCITGKPVLDLKLVEVL